MYFSSILTYSSKTDFHPIYSIKRFRIERIRRHHRNCFKINLEEELYLQMNNYRMMYWNMIFHAQGNTPVKQHVKFYTILKAKTLMLTYLRKNYLVIRFKGIKDLIFSSSNLKRHVKLLEEVTKYYVVNIQRTSVIPFFVRSHRKVKR